MAHTMEQDMKDYQAAWRYEMTRTDIDDRVLLRYTTYGVKAVDSSGNVASDYVDVSTCKALVEEIVDKCNRYEASVLHLGDIIEDFLD